MAAWPFEVTGGRRGPRAGRGARGSWAGYSTACMPIAATVASILRTPPSPQAPGGATMNRILVILAAALVLGVSAQAMAADAPAKGAKSKAAKAEPAPASVVSKKST